MDANDIRSILTVVALVAFLGIVFWAWSGRRRQAFDEAARIPLEDDLPAASGSGRGTARDGGR